MAYFGNILGAGAGKPKKFKPEEVPLYENREVIDAASNPQRVAASVPWWNSINTAAQSAATMAGQADSPLFGQLEQQAQGDLALGGQLDPWESYQATQGAREAWQARGLQNSAPAGFAEVLNRIQFSNQRRDQRRGFATGVAGLDLQRRQNNNSLLGTLTGASLAPYGLTEGQRQFDLERSDTLKFNDKSIAKDLKVGEQNAASARSAGNKSMFGSILGGIFGGI